jgi:NTE family protein
MRDQIVALLHRWAPAFLQGGVDAIVDAVQWFSLPGGNTLFRRGDPSDAIYVVLSGVLGVSIEIATGAEQLVGRLGPGEIVGEMGCITGETRSATVRALRSCELLALRWSDVGRIATKDPGILLTICRTVIQRMIQTQEGRGRTFQPRTFALVTIDDGIDHRGFGERFGAALGLIGDTFLVCRDECQNLTANELFQIEKAHEYVVYLTERDSPAWSRLCLRQTDAILVVAKGDHPPPAMVPSFVDIAGSPDLPLALVLNWDADVQPERTADWIKLTGASRQFHIRRPSDVQRVARLLTGRAFGLALSGGGARGLAHIGVARALRENGIDIDVIMGTSIGAVIGAGLALEWDHKTLLEKAHRFCMTNPLRDITIPRLSLLAGRNVRATLHRWFGDLQIEDTPIPYLCVSTNLNCGEMAIHKSGSLRMWTAASAAVPGVFPPVVVDGIVYVDGGVLNNLPADLIRSSGAGFVVGVDVADGALPLDPDIQTSGYAWPSSGRLNIFELLARVGSIGDEARSIVRRKQCDVLIVPPLSNVGLLSTSEFERTVEAGYRSAMAKLAALSRKKPDEFLQAPATLQL